MYTPVSQYVDLALKLMHHCAYECVVLARLSSRRRKLLVESLHVPDSRACHGCFTSSRFMPSIICLDPYYSLRVVTS